MGIIIRQSIKSTIVSYAGVLIGTFNTLWLLPRFLMPEQIGLIRLLQDIPLLLAVFLQFGAANLIDKFSPNFKDHSTKDNGMFMLLAVFYPLIGFIIFTLSFLIFNDFWRGIYENKSPLLLDYFFYILPLAFFMMYLSVLEAYCRVNLRIVVPAFIREVFVRILFSTILVLYALKIIAFKELIVLFVIIYGLSLLFLIGYIKNLKKLFLSLHLRFLNSSIVSEMGKYVLYIIPGTAGSLIASKIDTLMLGAMVGLKDLGVYSLAYFVGAVVEIPRRSLSQISIPFISQAWKNNDLQKIDELYKKTSLNQLIVGGLLFILIWVNVDDLLYLLPKSEIYKEGKYVILYIGMTRLFDMATGINSEIILYSRFYKFNLVSILFLAAITVVTNLIFINIYGINGAALAFAVTIFLFNVIKCWFIWYKFKLQPFVKNTWIVFLIGGIVYGVGCLIESSEKSIITSIFYIILRSCLLLILFMIPIFVFNVSEDLTNFANALKIKIFKILNL